MITDNGIYYLYRHIRLDTNEVFYVGIGTKTFRDIKYGYYTRANQKASHRSGFWHVIANKSKYIVEIILETDDKEYIKYKEREFINLYGRKDLENGSLVNLSDGGDGFQNRSKCSAYKYIKTLKDNGNYDATISRIIQIGKKNTDEGNTSNKPIFQYTLDGVLVHGYTKIKDCVSSTGVSNVSLTKAIKNKVSVMGYYYTSIFYESINISLFRLTTYNRTVIKICPNTRDIVGKFDSLQSAAKSVGGDKGNVFSSIHKIKKCKGFYWAYETGYELFIKRAYKKYGNKKLINSVKPTNNLWQEL